MTIACALLEAKVAEGKWYTLKINLITILTLLHLRRVKLRVYTVN